MSKNKSQKSGNAAKTKKTNEEHLAARMKDVSKILKLNEEGLDYMAIASKVRVGVTYVEEVIQKGAAEMEVQLRAGYGMGPKTETSETTDQTKPANEPESGNANTDSSMLDNATETKEQKKARVKAEKDAAKAAKKAEKEASKASTTPSETKAPKEKRTRENAILTAIKESNGAGLTLEAIGTRACEILSIARKSWTGTLGQMKRNGEITYNKETKLYNVA